MEQMEDVLYEIKKPTISELRENNRWIIENLRVETEKKQKENNKKG